MTADVVAVADSDLITRILVPAHARYGISFATNEIVVAHKDHSRYTDEITTETWTFVLLRHGVRLGRADADTEPLGYQTLVAWQLAENASSPGLSRALAAQCAKEHVATDEAALVAELESASVDYVFLYRSTAEDHHLKITALPPEVNLSRPDLAAHYAEAHVSVRMTRGNAPSVVPGAPITYGLTIPTSAPHPDAALRFVAWVLGDNGRSVFARRGLHPVVPARCTPCDDLPAPLRALVSSAP
jgi:molybdate/tungstate transport system substrate-binding protein